MSDQAVKDRKGKIKGMKQQVAVNNYKELNGEMTDRGV